MGQRIFSCVAKKKDQIKFKIIVIIIIAPAGFLAPEGQKPEEAP